MTYATDSTMLVDGAAVMTLRPLVEVSTSIVSVDDIVSTVCVALTVTVGIWSRVAQKASASAGLSIMASTMRATFWQLVPVVEAVEVEVVVVVVVDEEVETMAVALTDKASKSEKTPLKCIMNYVGL